MTKRAITHDDVVRLFGKIEDQRIAEILALGASYEELEQAAMWLAEENDVMGEQRAPLAGKVAQIYEILTRDEEFPEEPRPAH